MNADANAYAINKKNGFFLGVNHGYVDTVQSISNYLFTHKRFSTLFDSDDDNKSKVFDDNLNKLPFANEMIVHEEKGMEFTMKTFAYPKSPERAFFASVVGSMATDFAFLHEISHVLCGHFSIPKSYFGNNPDIDTTVFSEKLNDSKRYLLEFDADSLAFQLYLMADLVNVPLKCTAVDNAHYMVEFMKTGNAEPINRSGRASLISIYLFSLAFHLSMLLFSQKYIYDPNKVIEGSHPHPILRIFNIWMKIKILEYEKYEKVNNTFQAFWSTARRNIFDFWISEKIQGYELIASYDELSESMMNRIYKMITNKNENENPVVYTQNHNLRISRSVINYLWDEYQKRKK